MALMVFCLSGCLGDMFKDPGYDCVGGYSCIEVDDDAEYETRSACEYACLTCDYVQHYGSNTCDVGSYPVSDSKCCPDGYPYHCSVTQSCYTSCESAALACGSTTVRRADLSGGGGGGGSSGYDCVGGDCSYVSSGATYSTLSACESSCSGGGDVCVAQPPTMPIGCQYTCGGGTVTVGCNKCCPTSTPYYCYVTNGCYATCDQARSAGCTTPVHGY